MKTSAWNPQTAPKQGGSDTTIVRHHPTAYVPTASSCASMHILGMVGKMALYMLWHTTLTRIVSLVVPQNMFALYSGNVNVPIANYRINS